MLKMTFLSPLQISIHALREEGDSPAFCGEGSALVFLSTPSARRATSEIAKSNISVLFLSTPSARRATPASRCTFHPTAHFYPRPPRGGRPFWAETVEYTTPFLSTPSARRATHFKRTSARHNAISIHALREEGDAFGILCSGASIKISIHALREEGDSKNRDKISIFL